MVSAVSVKIVKTENGARKLRPFPRNLFNQQMPVGELSADCCQSLHHSHFVFRGKDDMSLDDLAKGSWIFYLFFLGPRSREMSLYLPGAGLETCARQPEPALEIFGILMQHIQTGLISESAGPRIALWSPLWVIWDKNVGSLWRKPKTHKQRMNCYYPITRTLNTISLAEQLGRGLKIS